MNVALHKPINISSVEVNNPIGATDGNRYFLVGSCTVGDLEPNAWLKVDLQQRVQVFKVGLRTFRLLAKDVPCKIN